MQVSGRILYVNPPKGNSRNWSLKIDNTYVYLSADAATRFRRGDNVNVNVTEERRGDKVYYNLVETAETAEPAPRQQNYNSQPQRSNGASAPPPQPSRSGSSNDQMIFITGVVGRSMQSGQFGLEDVMALTDAAKNAYERVVLGKTVRSEADFNDSIDHIGSDQDDPNRPPF